MFCKCAGYYIKVVAYFNGCELQYYLTCVFFHVHQTSFERNAQESAQQCKSISKQGIMINQYLKTSSSKPAISMIIKKPENEILLFQDILPSF